jgi:hypothetical protein
MRKKRVLRIVGFTLLAILLTPLWMYLAWLGTPKKPIRIAILDKTVLNTQCTEHESLNWVLKNNRYTRPNGNFYDIKEDYFGFFPKEKEKYELKGFEQLHEAELDALAKKYDALYITDTYGMYNNEWYKHKNQAERSTLIYGGLSQQDLYVLKQMKEQKKLILAEFNTIASPTLTSARSSFETMFGLHWSGWAGRYYEILDTLRNPELPQWLTRNYKIQHHNHWPFLKSGIVFIREDDHIEIIEEKKQLTNSVPQIETEKKFSAAYGLPSVIKYPYWFDILETGPGNKVLSWYHIKTNDSGDRVLNEYRIPKTFPAILAHDGSDYRFYYFCGDFADNPISNTLSSLKGIGMFSSLFYNYDEREERKSFFWTYYRPLVSSILRDYYKKRSSDH